MFGPRDPMHVTHDGACRAVCESRDNLQEGFPEGELEVWSFCLANVVLLILFS